MPMPTPITVHSRCPWYIDNAHRLIILCPKCPPHSQVAGGLCWMPPSAQVNPGGKSKQQARSSAGSSSEVAAPGSGRAASPGGSVRVASALPVLRPHTPELSLSTSCSSSILCAAAHANDEPTPPVPGDRAALPRPKRCCLSHCGSISTSTGLLRSSYGSSYGLRRLTADCCCCDCSLVWWLCAARLSTRASVPLLLFLSLFLPPTLPLALSLFRTCFCPLAVWLSHRLEKARERPRRMPLTASHPRATLPQMTRMKRGRRERAVAAARRDGLRAFLPRRRSSKAAASSSPGTTRRTRRLWSPWAHVRRRAKRACSGRRRWVQSRPRTAARSGRASRSCARCRPIRPSSGCTSCARAM